MCLLAVDAEKKIRVSLEAGFETTRIQSLTVLYVAFITPRPKVGRTLNKAHFECLKEAFNNV